jgi:hypothetical protein
MDVRLRILCVDLPKLTEDPQLDTSTFSYLDIYQAVVPLVSKLKGSLAVWG